MEVNEAVAIAKQEANCVFQDEHLLNLSLEEAVYDQGRDRWIVTLSFSRHIKEGTLGATLTNISGGRITFKKFVVCGRDKKVVSIQSISRS